MKLPSYRIVNLIAFLAIVAMLAFGGYLQFSRGLEPCPLCVIQRLIMALLGLFFLTGAIHHPRALGRKIVNSLVIFFSIAGSLVASRQVWLQHLPADQVPACGPGLNYIVNNVPFFDAIKLVLQGSGECAKVVWTFLGFSIPEWSLLFFIIFAVVGMIQMTRK